MVLVKSTNSLYAPPAMLKFLKSCFIAVNIPSAKQCNSSIMYSLNPPPLHLPIFKYIYRCIPQAIAHLILLISMNECPLYLLEYPSNIYSLMQWLRILMLHSCYQHWYLFFFLPSNMLTSRVSPPPLYFVLMQTASPMLHQAELFISILFLINTHSSIRSRNCR